MMAWPAHREVPAPRLRSAAVQGILDKEFEYR
jgi:hypothetical protein